MIKTMNGFVGFQSRFAVPRLVREARRRESAKAAVTWLAKVLGTDSGAGLAIQTLWGIAPTKRISISEGVDLLPLESLPPSCQKEQLINVDWHPAARRVPLPPFAWKPPPAALIAKTEIRPFLIDASTEKNSTDNGISQVQPPLDDIRLCLALEGPSIILAGPRWFQYVDPDLEAAVVTESRSYTHDEILPTIIPDDSVRLTSDVQIIVQKYMKLEPNIRNRTCNALDRLHQSLIRRNPADRALETSIALEMLLKENDDRGTNRRILAFRAALLISEDVQERIRNRAIIDAAYKMRNELVHGGKMITDVTEVTVNGFGKWSAEKIAGCAAKRTALVIKRVIMKGGLPEWNHFELSNGKTWK